MIKIKCVNDPPAPDDGKRILVDRLWPRGIKKKDVHVDEWLRDIARSDRLGASGSAMTHRNGGNSGTVIFTN